ncbi:MAG: hypothetical protein AB1Z98_36990 [Nannocystaceae bacterium]
MQAQARTAPRHAASLEEIATQLLGSLRRGEPTRSVALLGLALELRRRPVRAAWHPTGFVVLPLLHDDRGALRLHLWPAGERNLGQPCWPVHDHVWRLRSWVLCGTVHSHGYEVRDDPEGEAMLYAVHYGGQRRSCMHRSERRVRVLAATSRRVEAGHRYTVEAGAFHASRVEAGDFAATLVATERTDRAHPWVVGPGDGPDRVEVVRARADEDAVHGMLGRLLCASS